MSPTTSPFRDKHHKDLCVHFPSLPNTDIARQLMPLTMYSPRNSPQGSSRLGFRQSVSSSTSLIRSHWGRSYLKVLRAGDESGGNTYSSKLHFIPIRMFSLYCQSVKVPCQQCFPGGEELWVWLDLLDLLSKLCPMGKCFSSFPLTSPKPFLARCLSARDTCMW